MSKLTRLKDARIHLTKTLTLLYGDAEAKSITDLIINAITGYSRSQEILHHEDVLSIDQEKQFRQSQSELLKGRPVQYILGQVAFLGLTFRVDESVLIPRPETEQLVDVCLNILKNSDFLPEHPKLLDIGTGSGCIALSLKKYLPKSDIFAVDSSAAALATAQKNSRLNHLRVNLQQWNILTEQPPPFLPKSLDVIISNPPYITPSEKSSMRRNVLAFEPADALFVTDFDPLQFYKKIEQIGAQLLSSNGLIFFELNERYAKDVQNLFQQNKWNTLIKKDFQNKDRILVAGRKPFTNEPKR